MPNNENLAVTWDRRKTAPMVAKAGVALFPRRNPGLIGVPRIGHGLPARLSLATTGITPRRHALVHVGRSVNALRWG
jgi:hypothetical protein